MLSSKKLQGSGESIQKQSVQLVHQNSQVSAGGLTSFSQVQAASAERKLDGTISSVM